MALSWISPAPAQFQPTHEPAATPTSSTLPTCNWDLQSRDLSAPPVLRDSSFYLCRRLQESKDQAPGSCRIDCCPGQNINSQEGKSGISSWGAVTAQVLEGAFAVPRPWIGPHCWSSDEQSQSWGTLIYQNGPYSP